MPIGDKIRTLRKAMGLNQTELGKYLGVQTNAVSKWECGRVEDIPMSKVKAMASLFDVPVSYLIDDERQNHLPAKSEPSPPSDDDIKFALFGGRGNITEEMYDEVRSFAEYVVLREEKKKREE